VSAGGTAEDRSSGERPGQSPLAYLLHALNQPLTGLQCSLELALVSQRSVQQYIHCLNEGLQLTGRMRILVEAIQALIEAQQPEASKSEVIDLDALLRRTVDELQPVADSKNVRILVEIDSPLPVEAQRHGPVAVGLSSSGVCREPGRVGKRAANQCNVKELGGFHFGSMGWKKKSNSTARSVFTSGAGPASCPGRMGTGWRKVAERTHRAHRNRHDTVVVGTCRRRRPECAFDQWEGR
jgi:hypothetical protein